MRILLVNTLYAPYQVGGAEKSVQALAETLATKNHEVAVITLGEKKEINRIQNVSIFRLKLENIYWPFGVDPKPFQKFRWHWKDNYNRNYDVEILKIFREFQPDVLHTHNLGGFSVRIWELARQHQIPVFHTLRDYYLMSTSTTNLVGEKKLDFLFSSKRKQLSQRVDTVSGISEFILKSHLQNGYFKNAASVIIYNGFNFPNQKIHDIPFDKIRFGFIGQIKEHKGINLLLRVFEKLNSDKIILKIAGGAPEELVQTYGNNPQIKFLGHKRPEDFFPEIDVLIVPSLWPEPFGRVVMEALAQRKVVIGSKMGGIPELLKNNPDFLFDPDEISLLELMNHVISNPNILHNFKFEEGFLQNFTLETMVNEYESVYKRLILRADEN